MVKEQPQRRDDEYGYPSLERGVDFDKTSQCKFLEILRYLNTEGAPVYHQESGTLEDSSLSTWLNKDVSVATPSDFKGTSTGGLRLLLGSCCLNPSTGNRRLPFTQDSFELISQHMQLPEHFLPSMQARTPCAFKSSCFPNPNSNIRGFQPSTCYIFKLGIYRPSYYQLALSHSPTTNLTTALLLSKTSDHSYPHLIDHLTSLSHHITHPLLLPILLSEICLTSSASRLQLSDDRLNELEETMGQHEWINRPMGDPLKLDFLSTSRTLNFTSRILGVEKMRIGSRLLTLSCISSEAALLHASPANTEDNTNTWLQNTLGYHKSTAEHLLLRVEFEEKRVQTQLAVAYQFMVQKDSKVNIELAELGKKDSSAMKAIAVLTMCFLPGTFLATIFAMPLFNWDSSSGPKTKDGFKLYWAIAIPLTVGVLGLWVLSMVFPPLEWLAGWAERKRGRDVETGDSPRLKDE